MRNIFDSASTIVDLNKKMKEADTTNLQGQAKSKTAISILSNFSTQYLVQSLRTSLLFDGISPDIYESPFDQWELELNNPESTASRKKTDYTVILLSSTRLVHHPLAVDTQKFASYLTGLISQFKSRSGSKVIFTLPESMTEGFDQTSYFSLWTKRMREELTRELGPHVDFVDLNPLIFEFGFSKWHSSKFLITAKLCCHPNCFPAFGNYLSKIIQSFIKRPVRLVIADLDNTLWGGVVGDLGWENVDLDQNSNGYAHLLLQRYLFGLKQAGVLLAICSKNSWDVVKLVFENRNEMILKESDFVAMQVNWEPKSQNIGKILKELNLTQSGTVFLDDAKFEREEIRRYFPEIGVPELPDDIGGWGQYLARSGLLSLGRVTNDTSDKTDLYIAEKRRSEEASQHEDYSSFLRSLDLKVTAEKVNSSNFDRVFELIQKTNQFNLTTKRHSISELQDFISNNEVYCYCFRLQDKYSDYGIISVFIAEKFSTDWKIITWLMSCRAMGRGVENAVFNHFIRQLKQGCTIYGEYIETKKNQPVADLLDKMGFVKVGSNYSFLVGRNAPPSEAAISLADQNH